MYDSLNENEKIREYNGLRFECPKINYQLTGNQKPEKTTGRVTQNELWESFGRDFIEIPHRGFW